MSSGGHNQPPPGPDPGGAPPPPPPPPNPLNRTAKGGKITFAQPPNSLKVPGPGIVKQGGGYTLGGNLTGKFSGGSSSGSGGSGGGAGGAGTPPLPLLTFPKPPAWLHAPKSLNDLAGIIRNGFFAALGDLSGYPFNSTLAQSFQAEITLDVDGAGAPGISVHVWLASIPPTGGATLSAPLAMAQGTTDASGVADLTATGSFYVTRQYVVVVDVYSGAAITLRYISPLIMGNVLYRTGYALALAVGTEFTLTGKVTLDKGEGPEPAQGVLIDASVSQDSVFLEGKATTGADGTYSVTAKGIYDASGGAQASYDYKWQVYWGGYLVDEKMGAVNGETLVQGVSADFALKEENGQVTGGTKVKPPYHRQKG